MEDNNPGQTPGPTINVQNVSQSSPQQQPMSPPTRGGQGGIAKIPP